MIVINFNHRPISLARAKLNNSRTHLYDSQKQDKALLSFEALIQIKNQVTTEKEIASIKGNRPLFKKCKVRIIACFSQIHFFEKQDVDNIAKFYLDMLQSESMKNILWEDDSQVVDLRVTKEVSSKNSVRIEVLEETAQENLTTNAIIKEILAMQKKG